MAVTEIGDPRLHKLFGNPDTPDTGVKPVVRLPGKGLPPLALAGIALGFALLLFLILNTRRTNMDETQSTISPTTGSPAIGIEAPPSLYIPHAAPISQPALAFVSTVSPQPATVIVPTMRASPPQVIYAPQPAPPIMQSAPALLPQPRVSGGAPLVIDTGAGPAAVASGGTGAAATFAWPGQSTRQRASAFANRSTTVPQGHLIPAVLETAFNSTQAGFARAIVSRDVRSFDGKNVLIPRGSRLIGEYGADVAQGQNRAIIAWSRLIRPDGMTIALNSPAVDPQGRGGVKAAVNSHFFQRFGDALLQSTVQLGSAFTGRSVTGPVVVMQGGAANAASQLVSQRTYVPTLTVPAGKSISVFVAHDLDFGSLDRRQ